MNSTAIADAPTRQSRTQSRLDADRPRYELRQPLVALGLALPTALLLYLSFFPVAWGWLAWGALVPLLLLARSRIRPVTIYTMAMLAGVAFYWPVIQWMRVADDAMYFAWGFLATYCALYFPIAIFFIRYLDRRTALPLAVSAPIVWTALEYLRSELGTGFSWYLIGHTQHDQLSVIQIADLAGAYGVTFLVVIVNGLLADALWLHLGLRKFVNGTDTPPRYRRNHLLIQAAVVATLLLATCGYGVYRLSQNKFSYGPRIALLQGNLDQRIRNDSSRAREAGNHFVMLCNIAAQDSKGPICGMVGGSAAATAAWLDGPTVDLVVWPETSCPLVWEEDKPGVPADYCQREAAAMAEQWNTRMLLGLKSSIPEKDNHRAEYNSALLLDKGKAIDRYDKIHLVPLGEYVPFRQTFPILKKLSPYDFDYSVDSGRKHTRFPLRDKLQGNAYTFGVLICYEDTDPDVARPYGGGDRRPPADFILNTSNDGWFNGTSEHEEHLAIARFRAIECRRSVGRAVNMGVSALIDPNGHVLPPRELFPFKSAKRPGEPETVSHIWVVDQPSWGHDLPVSRWGEFKKVQGVMFAAVPIDDRISLYALAGDWLPWTCWIALAVGMFAGMIRRLRRV